MKHTDPRAVTKQYLAGLTARDGVRRRAAVEFVRTDLSRDRLAALAERLLGRYRTTTAPAVRVAAGASLSELGSAAVPAVLRALRDSRDDFERMNLAILVGNMRPWLDPTEVFAVAETVSAAGESGCDKVKAACGLAVTLLTEEELV